MPLRPGARLGPYEVLSAVGAGGMGEVYKARDTRLGRIVALKVLPSEYAANSDRRAALEREARAVAALSHPNICTLFDVGRDHDLDFLVMEYIDGETLSDRIAAVTGRVAGAAVSVEPQNHGGLPLADVLRFAIDIADALAAAHKVGVIHRDLKPGNVMLTKGHGDRLGSLQAIVLDFGLAKFTRPEERVGGATGSTITSSQAGTVKGTLPYMAPEQLAGETIDARTDLFALGAIIYEMVSGRRPFEADSDATLIAAILRDDPPPLGRFAPSTPPELQRLVLKCLTKTPDARWQSAADAADELRWLSGHIRTRDSLTDRSEADGSAGQDNTRAYKSGDRTETSLGPTGPSRKIPSHRLWAKATIALTLALAAASYEWSRARISTQQAQAAEQLCYSMKDSDVRVAELERQAAATGNAPIRAQGYAVVDRREQERRYEGIVARIYDKKLSEQDRLILRVTHLFGECETAAPPDYLREVRRCIAKWQQNGMFAPHVKLSGERGMTQRIARAFIAQNLPPQYYYLAMAESGFNESAIGPASASGIPKGIWQLVPGIAQAYGLRTGPRMDEAVFDAADERFNWERETDAASRYIKDLYATDAQASGLLAMAAYHWGGYRVLDALRTMPPDPRQRNFWRLSSERRIPYQTYEYVLDVVSAAVIGENPRLFGYELANPLKADR